MANLPAMSTHVNVAELKDRLAEYLARVEKGAEVIVCRRNVPVARFERIPRPGKPGNRSQLGSMKGTVRVLGDLTEPLVPEEDWELLK
jgi:antitoxin (DNA-binding transcriptional repressor) of toxin-antitoxin stability system